MRGPVCSDNIQGFSLIEIMMAIFILTFGLLAAGQLIFVSIGSGSLARSKGTAAVTAQNKLEDLAELYRRDPNAADLALGSHGPEQTQVVNPINGVTLNRYNVEWTLAEIADPRPGKVPDGRLVNITVTPIHSGGSANRQPLLNKILNVSTVLSPGTP